MTDSSKVNGPFRLAVVRGAFVLAALVLVWRGIDLHVFQQAQLQREGDARAIRVVPLAAHRGMIMDRNRNPLAISTPVDSLWVQPQKFLQARAQWPALSRIIGMDVTRMERYVMKRQGREFVFLKRRLTPDLAEQVRALNLPGVNFLREYRRYYPLGEVAAHIVGYTDVDDRGQEGIELAWEDWLRSKPGKKRVIRNRLGQVIEDVEQIEPASPGRDIVLSLDHRLQYLAYRELKRAVKKHRARSGSAVILDVRSGEVLAMVNQPAYNPNNRQRLKKARFRKNRAVTDVFEPGSTIKPFIVAAALERGLFTPHSVIDTTPGLFRVGHNTIRDIRNYGRIDVATILKKSSNVGATRIALATPPEHLWKTLTSFGFGQPTASGFPGEAAGSLPHYRNWREIERATLSFGYGLAVTPLQLAQAYAAIANGGMLQQPAFLHGGDSNAPLRIMKARTARDLLTMLEAVVSREGTAAKAAIPGYRIAGKTGTVKKVGPNGYLEDHYISVFVGIAPASDPRMVMVVTVDDPRGDAYYGGEVAAPVFARVMAGALRLYNVPMDDLDNPDIRLAEAGGRR
ncbi:MAG TPA: penicillin-binding protein 2 [Gammaproteobacteria bacterium]|nr:penicillin-binding protein 2 [Gammaproteobacteria bacterium]